MNDNDTVNMICDLIEYLITVNTNHSIIIDGCSSLICNDQNLVSKDNNDIAMADDATDANTSEQAKRTSKLVTTYVKFDDLLRMSQWEKTVQRSGAKPRMRLCGGGEDSVNNGTSAWGTPGAGNPGNSWGVNPQQPGSAWGANPQGGPGAAAGAVPSAKQQTTPAGAGAQGGPSGGEGAEANAWAAGNPVNPASVGPQSQPTGGANNAPNPNNSANPAAQQPPQQQLAESTASQPNPKLERLNTMIEALHALDGWGSENVNQDTRWEVPASPEPGSKPDPNSAVSGPTAGIPMWKTNTGTEIWEANLRNGGQMPQQQTVQKAPWGPATNHGGMWGEDDESGESNNVWNGGSAGSNPTAITPQGGPPQQPPWNAAGGASGGMWGPGGVAPSAIKKEGEWGNATGPAAGGGWDQRNVPGVGAPGGSGTLDPTNIDMRNMRIAGGMDGNREIRGDPRGISGRLNGNVNLWDQHQMPGMAPNKIPQIATPGTPAAGGQWPANQIPGGHNKMPSGWEDSTTQGVRRNVDDGTAVWGQNTLSRQNSNVPNWKEGSEGPPRNSAQRNSIVGNQLPGGPISARLGNSGPIKPDNLWGQNNVGGGGRGGNGGVGGWDDGPGGQNWEEKNSLWNENASAAGGGNGGGGWNKGKGQAMGGSNWNDAGGDMGSEWGMPGGGMNKPPSKMNPLEYIRNSKPYRMLCEMGFKKEAVETALRVCNMNLEESIEMLQRNGLGGDWRRPDEHGPGGFGGQFNDRFSAGGNSAMPFPQNNQNLLSGFGGNPNLNFNNMKFGAEHGGGGGASGPNSGASGPFVPPPSLNQNAQSQPSTHQLRLLVQQIQMAVQNGYLNHQILNQPLAPQTLLLLNQLLNHIKQLQVMQSNLNRSGGGGVSAVQISLAINKLKSQIGNLQNQITAQQTIYVKQQQQQQQQQQNNPNAGGHPGNDIFRTPADLAGLPGNFSDLSMKDNGNPFPTAPGGTSQQSRLNQWKLPSTPSVDKDMDLSDFARAPGTSSKPPGSGLGGIDDGTWSNGRSNMGDGWPDSSAQDNKDWVSNADTFTDLVPEFEPGKPWKGNHTTRIEDDPTITPGSVARSPLSIAAAKESNLFANSNSTNNSNNNATNSKSSPTESITSSTWSYNPSGNIHGGGGSGGGGGFGGGSKLSKNPWPDSIVPPADLWDTTLGAGKPGGGRVAPPGLKASGKLDANGWNAAHGGGPGAGGWNNSSSATWNSTWILLKNLTAQIDGSTLRTLCMQHGPLLAFHVYLNHGIALCKYSSRDEATKAQLALNSCMLSNTTICAEIPTENDVQNILQHLGPPSSSNGGLAAGQSGGQNWRLGAAAQSQSARTPAADTWGSAWPSSSAGSNLWAPLDGPSDRVTPANLNSFLPESLLGTELN